MGRRAAADPRGASHRSIRRRRCGRSARDHGRLDRRRRKALRLVGRTRPPHLRRGRTAVAPHRDRTRRRQSHRIHPHGLGAPRQPLRLRPRPPPPLAVRHRNQPHRFLGRPPPRRRPRRARRARAGGMDRGGPASHDPTRRAHRRALRAPAQTPAPLRTRRRHGRARPLPDSPVRPLRSARHGGRPRARALRVPTVLVLRCRRQALHHQRA